MHEKVIDKLKDQYQRRLKATGPNAPSTKSLRQQIEAYEDFGDKGLGQVFQMRPIVMPSNCGSLFTECEP